MKISSSGIGTVSTSQSCNAKSMFPYSWAWNSTGSTIGAGETGGGTATLSPWQCSLLNVSDGIEITSSGAGPYVRYFDNNSDIPPYRTAKLDNVEVSKQRYMHGIYDFSGWTTGNSFEASFGGNGSQDGSLYYYSTASAYKAVGGHSYYKMSNGKTVIVWDMHAATITGSGADWTSFPSGEAPFRFEPYFGSGNFIADNSMIWHGMILSDRILTDIPLPIRTHMG